MERLDKFLANRLNIPRSEAKRLLKERRVLLNGAPVLSGDIKCGETDAVTVDGKEISTAKHIYLMMNKPKGVLSASDGKGETTVVDLLPQEMQRRGLFPAGRLDKDTTGFILLTDDGAFAHDILSPKKHISKTYAVTLDKPVTEEVIRDFEAGMTLGKETLLPARLTVQSESEVTVVLQQGIFHQIKRMFQKHGITVLELKRTAMGGVALDETLPEGAARALTEEEMQKIHSRFDALA